MKDKLIYSYCRSKETQQSEFQIVYRGFTDEKGNLDVPTQQNIDGELRMLLFRDQAMRYKTKELLDFHFNQYEGDKTIFLIHTAQILHVVKEEEYANFKYCIEWLKQRNEQVILNETNYPFANNLIKGVWERIDQLLNNSEGEDRKSVV